MTKFAVGDLVYVYDATPDGGHKTKAIVRKVFIDDYLCVEAIPKSVSPFWYVHPKQCRKLKKKEKRRIWVNRYKYGWEDPCNSLTEALVTKDLENKGEGCLGTYEFIEVKKCSK